MCLTFLLAVTFHRTDGTRHLGKKHSPTHSNVQNSKGESKTGLVTMGRPKDTMQKGKPENNLDVTTSTV